MAAQDLVFTILGIDKASDKFDRVGDAIDRMTSRGVKALGGFTVASAASAAAVGAAVGALPLAFVGLGAVALKENTKVKRSFEDLSGEIKTGIAQDAAPLEDAFVGAADSIGMAYQRLRPELSRAFAASAPHVETLTAGVLGFAENAMPGMVRSVERADPVMKGFESLLKDSGTGLGEFFDVISERSEEAGEGVEHFGTLIKGVLPEVGGILGDLTGLWAEHGDEVADVVTRLLGVIGDLSGNALPLVSSSLGHALGLFDAILSVIEPMVGVLGPAIGAWISLAATMKTFGAVQSVISGVSGSVVTLGSNMKNAEKRAAGLKMAGAALALGVGMALSKVSALNPKVDALDEGLKDWVKTGKASGEAARVLGADMEHLGLGIDQVNASGFEKFVGSLVEGIPVLGNALQGLDSSFARGTERIDALDQSLADMVASGNLEGAAEIVNRIAEETGKSFEEVLASLPGYRAEVEQAAAATEKLGTSSFQSLPGIDALEESLGILGDQTADTGDKVDALNDAWKRLFGIALSMEEAQAAFEGGLDEIAESIKGVKEESENWRGELLNANGSINLTKEAGRQLSAQLITQGEDYRTLAQTAYDTALSQGKSQQEAAAVAVAASERRRGQFIAEMTQMGFTEGQARRLADRYLGMPDEVITLIKGDTSAAERALDTFIARYNGRTIHIGVRYETSGSPVAATPYTRFADGGIRRFANGSEDHRAQIARPGEMRLWAEPETGGEAYIPLGQSKRGRSTSILSQVADMFGMALVPEDARRFARGGMSSAAREMLGALQSGRTFYEDFSFRGMSSNARQWNDWFASRFRPTGGDFSSTGARNAAISFLRSTGATQQPQRQQVHISIDPSGLDDTMLAWFRKAIRVRGGNVQVVLGKST